MKGALHYQPTQRWRSRLERLKSGINEAHLPDQMAALAISNKSSGGIKRLFMSHPPLDERIAALRSMR